MGGGASLRWGKTQGAPSEALGCLMKRSQPSSAEVLRGCTRPPQRQTPCHLDSQLTQQLTEPAGREPHQICSLSDWIPAPSPQCKLQGETSAPQEVGNKMAKILHGSGTCSAAKQEPKSEMRDFPPRSPWRGWPEDLRGTQ